MCQGASPLIAGAGRDRCQCQIRRYRMLRDTSGVFATIEKGMRKDEGIFGGLMMIEALDERPAQRPAENGRNGQTWWLT